MSINIYTECEKIRVISLFHNLVDQHKTTSKLANKLPNVDDFKETVHEIFKENSANCSKINGQLRKLKTEGVREIYTENSCTLEKRSFTRRA